MILDSEQSVIMRLSVNLSSVTVNVVRFHLLAIQLEEPVITGSAVSLAVTGHSAVHAVLQ